MNKINVSKRGYLGYMKNAKDYHILNFNPFKNWYGVIDYKNQSKLVFYPYQTKVRSQAEKWMQKEAEKSNGELIAFGIMK